jgi:carboxymethylenebutenolidase
VFCAIKDHPDQFGRKKMNGNPLTPVCRFLNTTRCVCIWFVSVAVLTPGSALAQTSTPGNEIQITETRDTFESGKVAIQVIRYEQPGAAKRPAVVMLPGCDGWGQLTAYGRVAECLVKRGYVAVLIRYYDRTGTPDEVPQGMRNEFVRWLEGKAASEQQNLARDHFEKWMATVGDAVAYVRTLPTVDGNCVSLLGFSLGGYLAVSAAADEGLKLKAVVEMFGGVPEEIRPKLLAMPPMLILHGKEDTVVSVKEAYVLEGQLRHEDQTVEVEIYRGVGHVFIPPGKTEPNKWVVFSAMGRTMAFLDKRQK